MEATNKEQEALLECYRRLYKDSTPSADFDKLMEAAPEDEDGRKVIDFMAYEIEEKEFHSIVEDVISEYKIKPKYRAQAFRNAIYLGASPKFK
jgi:hypothetical protein